MTRSRRNRPSHNPGIRKFADLAVSGNHIFVVYNSTTVGEYDATTGAAIDANLITGLLTSFGLAVSGNHVFVTDFFGDTVGEYSATTGAVLNLGFIRGLDEPDGLTVSGNTLFVSSFGSGLAFPSGTVGEYDVTTGTESHGQCAHNCQASK
jgi:hypothetical protein